MKTVKDCIVVLAAHCDGAKTKDGQGFNSVHTDMGRYLSHIPQDLWDAETMCFVYNEVLPTYRKQLLRYDIDLNEVERPGAVENLPQSVAGLNRRLREQRRALGRRALNAPVRRIDLVDGVFVAKFEYATELVAFLQALDGSKWDADARVWRVPLYNKDEIITLGEANEFEIAEAVYAVEAPPKPVRISPYRIVDDGERLHIFFPYDDYEVMQDVRDIPRRKFEAIPPKHWSVPKVEEALQGVWGLCQGHDEYRAYTTQIQTMLDGMEYKADHWEALSSATDDSLVQEEVMEQFGSMGDALRPYQRAGAAFINAGKRVLVADDMGLGKTAESLASAHLGVGSYPVLVICPASVKFNWAKESVMWLPGRSVSIVHPRKKPTKVMLRGGKIVEIPLNDFDADILIINYDIVLKHRVELMARNSRTIILDECHMLKSQTARRSKVCKELAANVDYAVGLTGTPVLNRTIELANQLDVIGRLDDFGGFWPFATTFCDAHKTRWGWDFSGSSNLQELHEQLRRKGIYLRRTKEQVLTELPERQRTTVPFELEGAAAKEYFKAVNEFIEWLSSNAKLDTKFLDSIKDLTEERQKEAKAIRRQEKALKARTAQQLTQIEYLKQLAVKGKLESVKKWVEEFLESGQKLVLFGVHHDQIDELATHFDAPTITGRTDTAKRQTIVDTFQNDPDCKLLICNLQAGGVGITLTAASNVAFFELGWNPSAHSQAEARADRLGQRNAVNCWYFVAQGTIEEKIACMIEEKRKVTDTVIDGQAATADTEMIGDLTKWLVMQAAEQDKKVAKMVAGWTDEADEKLYE